LAILKRLEAAVFNEPENSTIGSFAANASNLLEAVLKSILVILEISRITLFGKVFEAFIPVQTADPP
jgi:hypothetical protein